MAIAAALVLVVLVLVALWQREHEVASVPAPPCPPGYAEQPGREQRLRAHLASVSESARLLEDLGETEVRFCFGGIEVPLVSEDRVLLLSRDGDEKELAARVGHLLLHVHRGSPFPDRIAAGDDCDAVVDRALRAEAPAYALEIRLRRAFGVRDMRYEFERTFWEEGRDESVILEYLRDHPEGGPGIDGLGAAYYQRCETERASARR